MTERHDVAVVGAGPVGLVLACLLARRGIDVVVLERRTEPSNRTRAVGIHPPGFAVLADAGIGATVRREATAIHDGVALCGGRRIGAVDFPRPVLALPQHRTEALLAERLDVLAPGALQRGVEVRDVAVRGAWPRPGTAVLTTSAGDVAAGVVVGADGVRSAVRAAAGIGWRPSSGDVPAYVMADVADTTGRPHTAVLHLEPDGVVESFPLAGDRRRWVVRAPATSAPDRAAFVRLVRDRVGMEVPEEGMTDPSAFLARQGIAAELTRGPVALVGDAAHEISPIGGQGMNLGWLDAAALADALASAGEPAFASTPSSAEARQTDSGADRVAGQAEAPGTACDRGTSALERALAAYAMARRRAALRAIRRARFNMRMGAPCAGAELAARNIAVRALSSAPLRARMGGVFAMRGL